MPCEICGRENVKVYLTNIDGALLYVCRDCNPSGKGIVKRTKKETKPKEIFKDKKSQKKQNKIRKKKYDFEDYEIVENYNDIIKKAREEKRLTLKELAQKLKEQESYIHKIELGKLKPNDKVIFKLYQVLGINLIKTEEDEELKNTEQEKQDIEIKNEDIFEEKNVNNKKKIIF